MQGIDLENAGVEPYTGGKREKERANQSGGCAPCQSADENKDCCGSKSCKEWRKKVQLPRDVGGERRELPTVPEESKERIARGVRDIERRHCPLELAAVTAQHAGGKGGEIEPECSSKDEGRREAGEEFQSQVR